MIKESRYRSPGPKPTLILLLQLLVSVSCLRDAPEAWPERLDWNPELAFPLGEKQFGMNPESGFDTALLRVDPLTALPDWVDELELFFEGAVEFDFSSITEELDDLNRLLVRVTIENGFPQEFLTQGFFREPGSNVVDSVFSGGPVILQPGTPQNGGETIRPYVRTEDVVFSRERLLAVQDVTEILFEVRIQNVQLDSAHIPYYPSYHFDIILGAMLDLDLEF